MTDRPESSPIAFEIRSLRSSLEKDRRQLESAFWRMRIASLSAQELDDRIERRGARQIRRWPLGISTRISQTGRQLLTQRRMALIEIVWLALGLFLSIAIILGGGSWVLALSTALTCTVAALFIAFSGRDHYDTETHYDTEALWSQVDEQHRALRRLSSPEARLRKVNGEFFCVRFWEHEAEALARQTSRECVHASSSIQAAMTDFLSTTAQRTEAAPGITVGLTRWLIRLRAHDLKALDFTREPVGETEMRNAVATSRALALLLPSGSQVQATNLVLLTDIAWKNVAVEEATPTVIPMTLPYPTVGKSDYDASTRQLLVTEAVNTPEPAQWIKRPSPALGGVTPEAVLPMQTKMALLNLWNTTNGCNRTWVGFSPPDLSPSQLEAFARTAAEFEFDSSEIATLQRAARRKLSHPALERQSLQTVADWLALRRSLDDD